MPRPRNTTIPIPRRSPEYADRPYRLQQKRESAGGWATLGKPFYKLDAALEAAAAHSGHVRITATRRDGSVRVVQQMRNGRVMIEQEVPAK